MNRSMAQARFARGPILSVVGALLVVAGMALAAGTEYRLVALRAAVDRHGGPVVDLGDGRAAAPDAQGDMVRVSGTVQVDEPPKDPQFDQQASAVALRRRVDMFQWHETRGAGPPVYEQDWQDHPVDAGAFAQPAGHANPGRFPIAAQAFEAGRARIGRYVLSPAIRHALPGGEPMAPELRRLPANLAASFSLYKGCLVTSGDPSRPRLGDLRVCWETVPAQAVTVVARLDGDRLVPAGEAAGGQGFAVQVGERSLDDMFPDLPAAPGQVGLRRLLAILLAALGASLLSRRRGAGADPVLALAAGLAAVGVASAVPWLGHGARAAGWWFALALLGGLLAAWRTRRRRAG